MFFSAAMNIISFPFCCQMELGMSDVLQSTIMEQYFSIISQFL